MPYFIPSIFHSDEYKIISLEEIVRILKQDYIDIVLKIRHEKKEEEKKRLKLKLPAFSLCEFEPGRLTRDNLLGTKYYIFDIDHISQQQISNLIDRFKKFATFWFVTPRGSGLKFIIEMEEFVDVSRYDANWNYYVNYFTESLGVEIDKSYRAYHTFFSQDPDCEINKNATLFPVVNPVVEQKAQDVNDRTMVPAELEDVCTYLGERSPLHYLDWVRYGLALKSLQSSSKLSESIGKKCWLILEQLDKKRFPEEHMHRDYEKKWEHLQPKEITISTLFYDAISLGYSRREQFANGEERAGYKCPFKIDDSGLYLQHYNKKEKTMYEEHVFSFRQIQVLFTIIAKDYMQNKTVYLIDGTEVEMPSGAISSVSTFAKMIYERIGKHVYLCPPSNTAAWQKLYQWMHLVSSRAQVLYAAPGLGNVAPGIWCLGNAYVADGGVYPYHPVVHINGKGYALEKNQEVLQSVQVYSRSRFWYMLEQVFKFFDNWAAMAIGWAVSNIFFSKIVFEKKQFPLLYLHGKTSSGKSELAYIVLSMFGVVDPDGGMFKINIKKATPIAVHRIKATSIGIPHIFDEFDATSDKHFHILKAMFDGSGDIKAAYTNDNQIRKIPVRSGCMLTSCARPSQPEAVNRCVYVDVNGLSERKEAQYGRQAYRDTFSQDNMSDLCAFVLMMIMHLTYKEWDDAFKDAYEQISVSGVISRVATSYAIVLAGYNCFLNIIKGKKVAEKLPKIPIDWWHTQASQVKGYIANSEPTEVYLNALIGLDRPDDKKWLQMDRHFEDNMWYFEVRFNHKQAYAAVQKLNLQLPSEREMVRAMKQHKWFRDSGTVCINSVQMHGYVFYVPDTDENFEHNNNNQEEIPF